MPVESILFHLLLEAVLASDLYEWQPWARGGLIPVVMVPASGGGCRGSEPLPP